MEHNIQYSRTGPKMMGEDGDPYWEMLPDRQVPEGLPRIVRCVDLSFSTFGKYQNCTQYDGLWWSDGDFDLWTGRPVVGALPAPRQGTEEGDKRARLIADSGGYRMPTEF